MNAKKYSDATEVCVSVQKDDDKLKFMVFDNGKGFECAGGLQSADSQDNVD